MNKPDVELQGRWVHKSKVIAGTRLVADGDFTCLCDGEISTVAADENGRLFVACAGPYEGDDSLARAGGPRKERHYLDGQLDRAGFYVGFNIAEPDAKAIRAAALREAADIVWGYTWRKDISDRILEAIGRDPPEPREPEPNDPEAPAS